MDVNLKIKTNLQVSAFYLFFIIHSIQIGIGILGLPRLVVIEARQDFWLVILAAYIYIILVVAVMLFILKQYKNADIYGIQVDIFGNWIGRLLGTIYIIYFVLTLFSVLITYMEVIRVFIFQSITNLTMGFLLIVLIVYSVLGGVRVIVGVCTLVTIFTVWIMLLLIEPGTRIDPTHLQPFFVASPKELLNGIKVTNYTFLGFEILFIIYPFIRNKQRVALPVFLGVSATTIIALIVTTITLGYFSMIEIERRDWVLLNLFKMQNFSFIERFDFIVVSAWMMVILPNMILLMWGVTYGMKRLYHVPQKWTLYILSIILWVAGHFFNEHFRIQKVINFTSSYGFWLVYIYPLILLPLVLIKSRLRKKEDKR